MEKRKQSVAKIKLKFTENANDVRLKIFMNA